jgi:hypothetical protein
MYKLFNETCATKTSDLNRFKHWTEQASVLYAEACFQKGTDQYKNGIDKFKGDSLEILAEIFFNLSGPVDPSSANVRNYIPTMDEDYGVDGIGLNANNDQVAVQVKYRANPKDLITYADISRTFCDGTVKHNLNLIKPNTILLFTTSSGITTQCKKFFQEDRGILKVLNFNKINDHIENNQSFWTEAWKLVQETINERINDVS